MDAHRLIEKIRRALNRARDDYPFALLAEEYDLACRKADERLDLCASLIRQGNDYPALQVAEADPPLLDLITLLSFAGSKEWRMLCQDKNLPCPDGFDRYLVEKVNGLYGREIDETHPLYRDYRRAMRLRNHREALQILRTLQRVNPRDQNAATELKHRLQSVARERIETMRRCLSNADTGGLVEAGSDLQEDEHHYLRQEHDWKAIAARLKEETRKGAVERCAALHRQCLGAEGQDDSEAAGDLLREWSALIDNFELSPEPSMRADHERITRWVNDCLARQQHDEAARNLRRTVAHALEGKENKNHPYSAWLKALQAQDDPMAERLAQQLTVRATRQRRKQRLIRGTISIISLVSLAFLLWGLTTWQNRSAEQALIRNRIAQWTHALAERDLEQLQQLIRQYQSTPGVIDPFANYRRQALNMIEAEALHRKQVEARLTALEKLDISGVSTSRMIELVSEAERMEEDIHLLPIQLRTGPQERWEALILGWKNRIDSEIARQESRWRDNLGELRRMLEEDIDYDQPPESVRLAVNRIRPILGTLEDIENSPARALRPSAEQREALDKLRQRLQTLTTEAEEWLQARRELDQSSNLAAYTNAMNRLEQNPFTPPAMRRALQIVLGRQAEWERPWANLLAPSQSDLPAKASEALSQQFLPERPRTADSIAFFRIIDNPLLKDTWTYRVFEFNNATFVPTEEIIRTAGEKQVEILSWEGGEETRHEVKLIQPDGSLQDRTYRLVTFTGRRTEGRLLDSGLRSPESQSLTLLQGFYNPSASQIRGPLLRALDLVRADKQTSPLFKAYLHQELYRIMADDPVSWGLAFSPNATNDYQQLRRIIPGRLTATDWLYPERFAGYTAELDAFYRTTGSRSYYREALFIAELLQTLNQLELQFAGHISSDGGVSLLQDHLTRSILWGLAAQGRGLQPLFRSQPSASVNPLDYSPLLYTPVDPFDSLRRIEIKHGRMLSESDPDHTILPALFGKKPAR